MTLVFDKLTPATPFASRYKVGQRVLWKVLRNEPHHYKPDEVVSGKIIAVFDNSGVPTYQLELDLVWNEHAPDMPQGQQIVVGNVREAFLSSLK